MALKRSYLRIKEDYKQRRGLVGRKDKTNSQRDIAKFPYHLLANKICAQILNKKGGDLIEVTSHWG